MKWSLLKVSAAAVAVAAVSLSTQADDMLYFWEGATTFDEMISTNGSVWVGSAEGDVFAENWHVWKSTDGSLDYGIKQTEWKNIRVADMENNKGRLKIESGLYHAMNDIVVGGGNNGDAHLWVAGGRLESLYWMKVGGGTDNNSEVKVSGGELFVGTADNGSTFQLGLGSSSTSSLTVSDTGAFICNTLQIAGGDGSEATFTIEGGTATAAFITRGTTTVTSEETTSYFHGTGKVELKEGTLVATTATNSDFIPAADDFSVEVSGGTINNENDIKITAAVTGTGWLTKTGAGTLVLTDVAGFTGRITVAENAGSVTVPASATQIKVGSFTAKAVTEDGIVFSHSATDISGDNHWTGKAATTEWSDPENWDTGLEGAANYVVRNNEMLGAPTSITFADTQSIMTGLWIENGLDGVATFAKSENAGDAAGLAVSQGLTVGTATAGALAIADGTYSAAWMNVGTFGGSASCEMTGGSLTTQGSVIIGSDGATAELNVSDASIAVTAGDFDVGIRASQSTFHMTSGTVSASGAGWWGADNSSNTATVSGGTLTLGGNLNILNASTSDDSTSDNTFSGSGTRVSVNEVWFLGSKGKGTIAVTDGATFTASRFGVNGSAAYVLGLSDCTLQAAADNVTFLSASDNLTVTVSGNVTLDTNGKTITVDAAMLGDGTLTCVGGGTVTFTSLDSTCTIVQANDGTTVNQPVVITWTGNGDAKSWNDKDNWSNGAVPTGSDVVRFSSNANIVVEDNDGSVEDIIIDDGVELGLTINGKYLYLNGDISGAGKLVLGNTTGLYFNNGAQTVGVDIDVKEGSSIAFIAKRGTSSNLLSGNLTGSGAITARIDSKNTNGGGFTFNGDSSGFSGTVLLDCNGNARPNMYVNAASSDNSGSSWTLNLGSSYDGGGSSYTSYFPFRSSNCIYKFGGLGGTIPWAKGSYGWLTGVTLQVGALDGDCELDGDWGNVSASGLDWAAASATMTYGLKNNSFINVSKGGTLKITSADVMRTVDSKITYSGANGTLKIASDVEFDPSTYLAASGSVAITFDDEGVSREWSGNLAGIYAFTKDGSGTLTLASSPAYGGPTKVLGGKLVVPFGTAMSTLELGENATVEIDMKDATENATAFSVGTLVGDRSKVSLVNNTSGVEFTLIETAKGFVYVNGSKSYTWAGPTEDDFNWSTPSNWGSETDVPTSADTVTFAADDVVYIDSAASALSITANGALTIKGPKNVKTSLAATSFVVKGSLTVSENVALTMGAMAVSGSVTLTQSDIDSTSYADNLADVNVGTMDIAHGFSGTGSLVNNGTLTLSGEETFIGSLGGGQSVTKTGEETYVLIGNNTFTGMLAIDEGTLKLGTPKEIADVRMDFDASDEESLTVDETTGYVTAWKDQINDLTFAYASGQHATVSTDFFGGKKSFSMTDTEETVADGVRRVTNYKLSESNKDRRSKMMFIAYQASLASEAFRSVYTEDQQRNFRIHIRGEKNNHYWCWHNGGSQNQITTGFYLNDVYGNNLVTQNPQVLSVADSLIRNKTGGSALCYEVLGSYAETAECFKGAIGEIISYNRNLTHAERKAVNAYLMAKWGAGSATYNVLPATANVTMKAGATLDMGGLTQTVASFTGAGTVVNGSLKTTGSLKVTGALTIPAVKGQTYELGAANLTLTAGETGAIVKIPDGAKAVGRLIVPHGWTVGSDPTCDVVVTDLPKNWNVRPQREGVETDQWFIGPNAFVIHFR